jgi:hypothetical protein
MVHLVKTTWSGLSGGSGITQLAIDTTESTFGALDPADAQAAVNAVRAYWNSISTYLPNEVTLNVQPMVDYHLSNNGELAGSVTAGTTPTAVVGMNAGDYSMAAGLKVSLNTSTIRNGRRIKGAIFLVPLAAAFSNTGGAGQTATTTINDAGTALRTALATAGLKLQVWSRPIPDGKPKGPRDGATADVTSMSVSPKTAILRGRRD